MHCGEIPRNSDAGHSCGCCGFGCASGAKQDGTATFLADAVAAGAKILTGALGPLLMIGGMASTVTLITSISCSGCIKAAIS